MTSEHPVFNFETDALVLTVPPVNYSYKLDSDVTPQRVFTDVVGDFTITEGSTTKTIASIELATVTGWESDVITIRLEENIAPAEIVLSFKEWFNPPNTKALSEINFKIVRVGMSSTNLCGDEGCIIANYNAATLTAVSTDKTLTSATGSITNGQGVPNHKKA